MTDLQRGIIHFIRAAVTGEGQVLPADFSMAEALPVIYHHQIVTLAYSGAVRCGIGRDTPEMRRLFADYCRCLAVSHQQAAQVEEIAAAFEREGVDYLPLKGCVLKDLYPKPEFRSMGDADILVRMEQVEKTAPLMEAMGYQAGTESDHELPWRKQGTLVELHKRLVPTYDADFYAYYRDAWHFAAATDVPHRFTMKPEETFVFLVVHFAKHYRDRGIGCRHMTDLWVYRRAYAQMDEDYIRQELEKLHLAEFYRHLLRTVAAWFDGGEEDAVTRRITDTVFSSGVFGDEATQDISMTVREGKLAGGDVKKNHWRNAVFPPLHAMRLRYGVLKKVPMLLPLCWGVRIVETLLFHRDRVEAVRRDVENINMEQKREYEESLRAVGLDYFF